MQWDNVASLGGETASYRRTLAIKASWRSTRPQECVQGRRRFAGGIPIPAAGQSLRCS
jgi:hypothetical protein